jgi:hypothetical protein
MAQNVPETFEWGPALFALVFLVLIFWIPVGVFNTPDCLEQEVETLGMVHPELCSGELSTRFLMMTLWLSL